MLFSQSHPLGRHGPSSQFGSTADDHPGRLSRSMGVYYLQLCETSHERYLIDL